MDYGQKKEAYLVVAAKYQVSDSYFMVHRDSSLGPLLQPAHLLSFSGSIV